MIGDDDYDDDAVHDLLDASFGVFSLSGYRLKIWYFFLGSSATHSYWMFSVQLEEVSVLQSRQRLLEGFASQFCKYIPVSLRSIVNDTIG